MISNLSLSACSATDLRPASARTPVGRGEETKAASAELAAARAAAAAQGAETRASTRAASERPPVEATPGVNRVRAQSDTRPAPGALSLGTLPPPNPGKPAPRGSLLDLSV